MKLSILEEIYLSYIYIVYRDSYNTFIISTSFSALSSQPSQYHTCDPLVTCLFVGHDLKMLAVWITKRCPLRVVFLIPQHTNTFTTENQFDCCFVEWWKNYIYTMYTASIWIIGKNTMSETWQSCHMYDVRSLEFDGLSPSSMLTLGQQKVESPLKDLHII